MIRLLAFCAVAFLLACGTHGSLPGKSTAACTHASDCEIPYCPDACNGGQGVCGGRTAYGVQEALGACPCLATPDAKSCAAPMGCEQPPCAYLVDSQAPAVGACVSGHCVALLLDGGTAP